MRIYSIITIILLFNTFVNSETAIRISETTILNQNEIILKINYKLSYSEEDSSLAFFGETELTNIKKNNFAVAIELPFFICGDIDSIGLNRRFENGSYSKLFIVADFKLDKSDPSYRSFGSAFILNILPIGLGFNINKNTKSFFLWIGSEQESKYIAGLALSYSLLSINNDNDLPWYLSENLDICTQILHAGLRWGINLNSIDWESEIYFSLSKFYRLDFGTVAAIKLIYESDFIQLTINYNGENYLNKDNSQPKEHFQLLLESKYENNNFSVITYFKFTKYKEKYFYDSLLYSCENSLYLDFTLNDKYETNLSLQYKDNILISSCLEVNIDWISKLKVSMEDKYLSGIFLLCFGSEESEFYLSSLTNTIIQISEGCKLSLDSKITFYEENKIPLNLGCDLIYTQAIDFSIKIDLYFNNLNYLSKPKVEISIMFKLNG